MKSKSHRSIMPLGHATQDKKYVRNFEYELLVREPWRVEFTYGADPTISDPDDPDYFGLIPAAEFNSPTRVMGMIQAGTLQVNAVGRHHPGGDEFGGTVNFLYVDGGVARRTIRQTLYDYEWGERYYSLTGNTKIYFR